MEVSFKDGILYSNKFDDIYFNTISPLSESKFVFESALDEIWEKQESFIVAEAGFGVGLNFLNLAKKFKRSGKILHYVGIEKYPLSREILSLTYKNLDEFKNSSKKLIKIFSSLKPGLQRVYFSKNIILDLYIGDIKEALINLDFEADVWFMDGFAPSKNPDMWDLETIKGISNLSKCETILVSYSSARIFRENLKKCGFGVEVLKGFARKREMTKATFLNKNEFKKEIYYSRAKFQDKPKKILIIGTGIAGLATAFKLQNLGFEVLVAEKKDEVALNGSGNLIGALMPLITQKGVLLGKMHESAFDLAVKFYKKYAKKYAKFSGAKVFAYDEELVKRYKNSNFILKNDKPNCSVFIEDGASIRPKETCEFLSKNLDILFGYEFISFEKNSLCYDVIFKNNKIVKADAIVFAMGSHSEELFNFGLEPRLNLDEALQISSVRGQTTLIKPRVKTKFPLSSRGYICPVVNGAQLLGSTYDRKDYCLDSRFIDDVKNLESVEEFLGDKKVKILGSYVGFRSYSGDRFPIIGALHDSKWFIENYKNLLWNKNKELNLYPKHFENIYLNTAHGARGLGTAIMGAEMIADMILKRPFCVSKDIVDALNPARFLIRKLKKGLL